MIRVACVQMGAGDNLLANFEKALRFAKKAHRSRADVIAFPENFLWRGPQSNMASAAKFSLEAVKNFKVFCMEKRVACVLGSLIFWVANSAKFYNCSVVISSRGKILGFYRKMHLFNVSLPKVKVKESKCFRAGNLPVVLPLAKGVKAGLSICYDLRFPELYRHLSRQGAQLLFVPSNFTHETGKAHWEILLRARAIENQCFVVAPGQCGTHPDSGIKSYGHSMMIDPWGKVLASLDGEREGVVVGGLDLRVQRQIRARFPVLRHRKMV